MLARNGWIYYEFAVDDFAEERHSFVGPGDPLVAAQRIAEHLFIVADRYRGTSALGRIRLGQNLAQPGAGSVVQQVALNGDDPDRLASSQLFPSVFGRHSFDVVGPAKVPSTK